MMYIIDNSRQSESIMTDNLVKFESFDSSTKNLGCLQNML